MKRILSLIILIPLLTACGAKAPDREISENEIQYIAKSIVNDTEYLLLDLEDIEFVLSISPAQYQNAWVWLDRNGATINEIAVFVANTENADALYQTLVHYVDQCKTDKAQWLESYNPPEAIKLQNGKVFRYGNCMGYTFADEDKQNALFKKLEETYYSEK